MKWSVELGRGLFETAPDAIVGVDESGRIRLVNAQAEAMFGYPRDELLGEPIETLIPERYHAAHIPERQGYVTGPRPRPMGLGLELTAQRKDGGEFPVEISISPLRTRQGLIVSAAIRDITERKKIEQQWAEARDQAMESARLKSEFMATMSHEIRTPMNGVIGLTELLLGTDLSAEQRRYAEGIGRAGGALLAVINDILDFSKLEAGRMILDEADFCLTDLVDEVLDLVAETARGKRLHLIGDCHPDLPDRLHGDPNRLRQILLNLAANAVKFTDTGEVLLRVSPAPNSTGTAVGEPGGAGDTRPGAVPVWFEVVDTGIGITPAALERLFVPFSQADASTTRRYGGTGLGLTISRELAEVMGGQLAARSVPGEGSTFTLSVPLGTAAPAPADTGLAGRRILVVDTAPNARIALDHRLRRWGAAPVVTDLATAPGVLRAAADKGRPLDAVLVDQRISGRAELDLARRIAANPRIPPVPLVLLVTGWAPPPLVGASSGARTPPGVTVVLTKPVGHRPLREVLDRLLVPAETVTPVTSTPVTSTPAAAVTPGDPRPPAATPPRVLLVEDNDINQLVAVSMLRHLGYTVDVAGNGREALGLIERANREADEGPRPGYAAVLMDCQMPVLDGYEATAELRRREATPRSPAGSASDGGTPHLPVIAMTASALAGDRQRCLDAGMDDYVPKPIDRRQLSAVLRRWAGPGTGSGPWSTTAGTSEQGTPDEGTSDRDAGDRDTGDRGAPTHPDGVPTPPHPDGAAAQLRAGVLHRIEDLIDDSDPETIGPVVTQLVASFLERTPQRLASLRDATARGDTRGVERCAHALTGATGNLGLTRMATLCGRLELTARSGSLESAPALLQALDEEFSLAQVVLTTLPTALPTR